MNKNVVISLLVILALIIVLAMSFGGGGSDEMVDEEINENNIEEMTENEEVSEEESVVAPAPVVSAPAYASVVYGFDGFAPSLVTIRSGGSVTISNIKSTRGLQVMADSGAFSSKNLVHLDESDTFIIYSPGTYTYYNKLKPEHRGTIIVK